MHEKGVEDDFNCPGVVGCHNSGMYDGLHDRVRECSILLCMSCLVGTTWAWFTVSIENTGNVIEVGEPGVYLQVDGQPFVSGSTLTVGTHTVSVEHANKPDDLNTRSKLYVTITTHSGSVSRSVYTMLNHENQYMTEFTLNVTGECSFSWEVSWFVPTQAQPLTGDTLTVALEEMKAPAESTEPQVETTEGAADPAPNPGSENAPSESGENP